MIEKLPPYFGDNVSVLGWLFVPKKHCLANRRLPQNEIFFLPPLKNRWSIAAKINLDLELFVWLTESSESTLDSWDCWFIAHYLGPESLLIWQADLI